MKMLSISKQQATIGVILLTVVTLTPVLSQDSKCADELNPFNIRPYEVPKESMGDDAYTEQLALYWIARDDLGCAANHNDDLKKKVNFTRSAFPDIASRVYISEKCQDHVKFWMDRIVKVVQHNLLVTLKVKAIRFFEPAQYTRFKRFQFKDSLITNLPLDQILQAIDKTGTDLKNGLTLPDNAMLPSYDAYNITFSEVLQAYNDLYHALFHLREVLFNRVNGCDSKDTQCLDQLYKTLVGESNDWSGRVLGYSEIRKEVENGIRIIRSYFRGRTAREQFDVLKLPMTPPCFST